MSLFTYIHGSYHTAALRAGGIEILPGSTFPVVI